MVKRLYDGDHAYILQNPDKRIVFAIPYERDFTLIGTTDVPYDGEPGPVSISPEETDYLCDSINRYFARPIAPADVVWSYSGVRPLFDDAAENASAVTRDYVLDVEDQGGRAAGALGVRRQDHHLPAPGRARAGEAGAVLPRPQGRPGPATRCCPAAP